MQPSFKTIEDCVNFKLNCPICSDALSTQFDTVFKEDAVKLLFENQILSVSISSEDSKNMRLCLPVNSNAFTFTTSNMTETEVSTILNRSYVSFVRDCNKCNYYLAFHYLMFDIGLKRISKIKATAEQINLNNYNIYNDFYTGTCNIYSDAETIATFKNFVDFSSKSLEQINRFVNNAVIFS